LQKLERDHDPTDRIEAMRILEEANRCNCLLTGLIYIDTEQPSMTEIYNLPETPLNRLPESRIRPGPETIQMINDLMF
jgi:2-oxoglutarate ferredoxin oxidoreductase subunit beta